MGTISDKLTYLNTTKGLIKDSINLTGANITNDTFRSYAQKLKLGLINALNDNGETIFNNLEKVSGKGSNLSLTPTYEAPIGLKGLYGNTSQTGTPTPSSPIPIESVTGLQNVEICGKNLFDTSNAESRTHNGITFTLNNDGSIKANGTASSLAFMLVLSQEQSPLYKAGNYAFSLSNEMPNNCYVRFEFYDSNNTMILRKDITTNGTATLLQNCYLKVSYVIASGTVLNNFVNYIQIEKGSTATPYKPYNGNTYEVNLGTIELNKIGDYEDSIKKSTGKNLLKLIRDVEAGGSYDETTDTYSSTTRAGARVWYQKIPVESGKYTFSCSSISNAEYRYKFSNDNLTNASDIVSLTYNTGAGISYGNMTINNADNYKYLYVTFRTATENVNATLEKPMLEKGDTFTSYEPYGKVWYRKKNIGEKIIEDNSGWGKSSRTDVNKYYIYNYLDNGLQKKETTVLVCNYLNCISQDQCDAGQLGLANLNGNGLMVQFALSDTDFDTLQKWKTFVGTYKPKVLYVLATPTYEVITNTTLIEQLETLSKAKSKNGTTNIVITSQDLAMLMDVSVIKGDA